MESKPSLLHKDEFSNRIISRKSSIGNSSRVQYYCRSGKGIPFKWEMQPGTPIDQPEEEPFNIPPISPPPALLSLGLPKPSINIQEPKPSMLSRLKFWKNLHSKKHILKWMRGSDNDRTKWNPCIISNQRAEGFIDFERCRSHDGESITSSPPNSSSSSCSSSHDGEFITSSPPNEENLFKDSRSTVYGCTPWNVSNSPIFIRFYKKD